MSSHVAKLATAGSFGIALLGLYFIFNSTSVQLSLSACAMYIVGTVVGVILMQSDKRVARTTDQNPASDTTAYVCFAPKATVRPSSFDPSLCANRVLTHRSKKHRYSITSSAAGDRLTRAAQDIPPQINFEPSFPEFWSCPSA